MILATQNSEPSATEILAVVAGHPASLVRCLPDQTACRFETQRVVASLESSDSREIVDTVFTHLLRLLECLALVESQLRHVDAADETFALFQVIHDEARVLVNFIRKDALNRSTMSAELADTLDGISFALNHDLQRVFESDDPTIPLTRTARVVIGKLYRAHDVMTNCLQQSTITLAMVFDSELIGARLFNNSSMRKRQSLRLRDDLSALLKIVDGCETEGVESGLVGLSSSLRIFREQSMEGLMYSDWPQFESFCERIDFAIETQRDLASVLHEFRCYVETLLGQVRMRAVLGNQCDLQPEVATHKTHAPSLNPQINQTHVWNKLAIAV
jgi:hypothetical protein